MNQIWTKALPPYILDRLMRRPGLLKPLANTGWLFIDKILALLVSLSVGVWVARYLGPAQFGTYNYVLAFVALFAPLARLGLNTIVVRELVREPSGQAEILGTAFMLRVVSSGLTLLLVIGMTAFLSFEQRTTHWLIGIVAATLLFQSIEVIEFWFQAQLQAKYIVWAKKGALVSVALVKVALILLQAPLIAFVWAVLIEAVLATAGLIVLYHFGGRRAIAWKANLLRAKRLLIDSWPLLFSSIAIVIYMKIDQIMLGSMVSDEAVGIYAVAVRLSELWYFVPVAVSTSVFPAIIRARENQSSLIYRQRMQTFYDIMAVISYLLVIALTLIATPLIITLFGPDYAEAGPILTVHVWAFMFVSLGLASNKWLVAENLTKFSLSMTILGAVFNVGLNYWLIPKYGGLGAAWATVISQAVSAYLSCVIWRRLWSLFGQLSLSLLVPFRIISLKRAVDEIL